MNSSSHTAILLATMNGARYLPEQLGSIANQTHTNWSLWISDDGSSDDTRKQIREFIRRVPENKVYLIDGPGRGATCNFMSLLGNPGIDADMVAFSDQDDVWLPERLEQSLNKISQDVSTPALYGGRTIVVDQNQKRTGMSPDFTRKPGFSNALVQSLAGGNTMLFNRAAHHLLRKAGTDIDIVAHDWWVYLLVSGAGGAVFYDQTPFVLYRQHSNNLIGSNAGYRAQMARINGVLRNRFRNWNTKNIAALRSCESLLSPENLTLLSHFEAARKLKGAKAVREIEKIGIYRQTKNGTKSLKLAAALGKI